MNVGILLLTFSLALVSLLYELLIAQTMALLAANTVVWYGLIIGIFIGSMGLGALWAGHPAFSKRPWGVLALVEGFLAIIGGGAAIFLNAAHSFALGSDLWGSILFFGTGIFCAFCVGFLTGVELPVLISIGEKQGTLTLPKILAADYFGSLVAGVIFPLWLVPLAGSLQVGLGVGAVSMAIAVILLFIEQRKGGEWVAVVAACLVFVLAVACWRAPLIEMVFAKKYYQVGTDGRVDRFRSSYQQIDIVHYPDGQDEDSSRLIKAYLGPAQGALSGWGLFLNNDFQFSSDLERIYHEAFVHVPLLAAGVSPKKVLILGAGDGLLAREVLKYPDLQQVVLVEIDPQVLRLFRDMPSLQALNDGALKDPRLTVITGDAYDYVHRHSGTYDVIYLDFPNAADYDLSKLYSREFYSLVRQKLAPGGLLVMDAPGLFPLADTGGQLWGDSPWGTLQSTLRAAGFQSVVPFFSRLEADNPAVMAVMADLYDGVERVVRTDTNELTGEKRVVEIKGAKEVQREMATNLVHDLTAGLIMAVSQADFVPRKDPNMRGVPLRVLDPLRYRLSLDSAEGLQDVKDAVNSVFHPVLPKMGAWWKIRLAY